MGQNKKTIRGLWSIHISTLLFGLSGVFAALIHTSAAMAVFGRAAFALVLLGILAFFQKTWPKLTLRDISRLVFIGFLLFLHWVAFFGAVHKGGVAVGTLGFACFPVAVSILEFIVFKENLTRSEITQILFVSLGLILVSPNFELTDQSTIGLLLGILSGVIYAFIAILNRSGISQNKASAIQGSCWQFLGVILIALPFIPHETSHISIEDIFWMACLGILSTGIAYVLFIKSLEVIKARIAAIVISLETVYAILIAWVFLHQIPSFRMLIGGLIIIAAVIFIPKKS